MAHRPLAYLEYGLTGKEADCQEPVRSCPTLPFRPLQNWCNSICESRILCVRQRLTRIFYTYAILTVGSGPVLPWCPPISWTSRHESYSVHQNSSFAAPAHGRRLACFCLSCPKALAGELVAELEISQASVVGNGGKLWFRKRASRRFIFGGAALGHRQ